MTLRIGADELEMNWMDRDETEKGRRYIDHPDEAPEGVEVHQGPQGGLWYETDDVAGASEESEAPPVDTELVTSQATARIEATEFTTVGENERRKELEGAVATLEDEGVEGLTYRQSFVLASFLEDADDDESLRQQAEELREYGEEMERAARENLIEDIEVGPEFDGFAPMVVGGAVRDHFLGLPADAIKDIDLMAVPEPEAIDDPIDVLSERMQYVDAESAFPVFLDSEGREVALPRTEESTGPGFSDFEARVVDPDTPVDEAILTDLERRDMTIGAMAMDARTGELFDPYDGQNALVERIIRPVSEAFQEDPVRALRAARFAPRFDLDVADSIEDMSRDMREGIEQLPDERRMAEMQKTLVQADDPGRFFTLLEDFGVLDVSFPEVEGREEEVRVTLEDVAAETGDTETMFAGLGAGLDDAAGEFVQGHTMSNDEAEAIEFGAEFADVETVDAADFLTLAERIDSGLTLDSEQIGQLLSGLRSPEFGAEVAEELREAVGVVTSVGGSEVMDRESIDPQNIGDEISGEEFREMVFQARLEEFGEETVVRAPDTKAKILGGLSKLLKERRYVDHPDEVPEGYDVQEGPQGGLYYEVEATGGEESDAVSQPEFRPSGPYAEGGSHSHTYDEYMEAWREDRPPEFRPPGYDEAPNDPDAYAEGQQVLFSASRGRETHRGTVQGTDGGSVSIETTDGEQMEVDTAEVDFVYIEEDEPPTGADFESLDALFDSGYFSYTDGLSDENGVQHAVWTEWMTARHGGEHFERASPGDPNSYEETMVDWRVGGYWMADCYPLWKAAQEMADGEPEIPDKIVDRGSDKEYLDGTREVVREAIRTSRKYAAEFLAGDDGTITVKRGINKELAKKAKHAKERGQSLEVDPRSMESWSLREYKAEEYGSVVIERELTPEDVAFYGPLVMPPLADVEEITALGNEPYEIRPENIEIVEDE